MQDTLDGNNWDTGLSLSVFDLRVFIPQKLRGASLSSLDIIKIENLREFDGIDRGLAWRLQVGWQRDLFFNRDHSVEQPLRFAIISGLGLESAPGDEYQVYGFGLIALAVTDPHLAKTEFSYGSALGIRGTLFESCRLKMELVSMHQFSVEPVGHMLVGELLKGIKDDWSLGLSWSGTVNQRILQFQSLHYF